MNVNNKDINLYNFKDKNEIGYLDLYGKSIEEYRGNPNFPGDD